MYVHVVELAVVALVAEAVSFEEFAVAPVLGLLAVDPEANLVTSKVVKVALCAHPVALLERHDEKEMIGQYWDGTLPISPLLSKKAHGSEIKLVSDESELPSSQSESKQEHVAV